MNLRPPTPGMRDQELVQWFQRVYDAIKELDAAIKNLPDPDPPDPPDIPTSHNQLTENGGNNSHTVISQHMATDTAHQSDGPVVGRNELNQAAELLQSQVTELKEFINLFYSVDVLYVMQDCLIPQEYNYVRVTIPDLAISIYPPNTMVGRTLHIDNGSFGNLRVATMDMLTSIHGERVQIIPEQSSATLFSDGFSWRFV